MAYVVRTKEAMQREEGDALAKQVKPEQSRAFWAQEGV